jgi:hypothetical protein
MEPPAIEFTLTIGVGGLQSFVSRRGGEPVDAKHRQLVRDLHDRIYNGMIFTETDVVSLLILVRQEAGKHVREFADSIAHRERDRGLLWDFPKKFDRLATLPKAKRSSFVPVPIQVADLHREFNVVFTALGFENLAYGHVESIAVLAASVLDGTAFKVPRKPPSSPPLYPLKSLVFGFEADFVGLYGDGTSPSGTVRFPLFGVGNRFFNAPAAAPKLPWFPRGGFVAQVALRGGFLQIEERASPPGP